MLVSLVEADGIPEGCLLSVRAGTNRRQASIGTDKPCQLSFPKPTTQTSSLKVDLLAVLGSCSVDVNAARGTYPCEVKSNYGGEDMQITLRVQDELDVMRVSHDNNVDSPRHVQKSDDNTPQYILNVQSPAAVGAHAYLDSHDLLTWLHDILQLLIRDRPDNPWSYIDQSTAKAKAALESASAQPQVNAPPHSTDPELHANIIPGNVVASTVILRERSSSPERSRQNAQSTANTPADVVPRKVAASSMSLCSPDSVAPERAVHQNIADSPADVIPGNVSDGATILRSPLAESVAPERAVEQNIFDTSRKVPELAEFQPTWDQCWQLKPSVGTWCSPRNPKFLVTCKHPQRAADKMSQVSTMNDSDLREDTLGQVGSNSDEHVDVAAVAARAATILTEIVNGKTVAPDFVGEKADDITSPNVANERQDTGKIREQNWQRSASVESYEGLQVEAWNTQEQFRQTRASEGLCGGPLAARSTQYESQEAWRTREQFWQTRASVGTCGGPPGASNARQQLRRSQTTRDDPWKTQDSFWHHRASVGTWCQPQSLRNTAMFELPDLAESFPAIAPTSESGKHEAVSSEERAHSSQRNSRPAHAHMSSVPALPRLESPAAIQRGRMLSSDMANSQSLPSLPMSSPLLGAEEKKSSMVGASAMLPSSSDQQSALDEKRQKLSNEFLSQNERLRRENARLKRLRETRDKGVVLRSENEQLKSMLGKLRTVHIVPPVV